MLILIAAKFEEAAGQGAHMVEAIRLQREQIQQRYTSLCVGLQIDWAQLLVNHRQACQAQGSEEGTQSFHNSVSLGSSQHDRVVQSGE